MKSKLITTKTAIQVGEEHLAADRHDQRGLEPNHTKKSAEFKMGICWNGWSFSKWLSPETMQSAKPSTVSAKTMLSSASSHAVTTTEGTMNKELAAMAVNSNRTSVASNTPINFFLLSTSSYSANKSGNSKISAVGVTNKLCNTKAGGESGLKIALTSTFVSMTMRMGYVIDSLMRSCTCSFDKFCNATLRCMRCIISKADSFFSLANEFSQNCTKPESLSLSAFESLLTKSAEESGISNVIVRIAVSLDSKIIKKQVTFNARGLQVDIQHRQASHFFS